MTDDLHVLTRRCGGGQARQRLGEIGEPAVHRPRFSVGLATPIRIPTASNPASCASWTKIRRRRRPVWSGVQTATGLVVMAAPFAIPTARRSPVVLQIAMTP
jgi:hypothetical protein